MDHLNLVGGQGLDGEMGLRTAPRGSCLTAEVAAAAAFFASRPPLRRRVRPPLSSLAIFLTHQLRVFVCHS